MRPLGAAEPLKPKRSVFIYIPNGVNTLDYQITTPGVRLYFFAHTQASRKTSKSSDPDQWTASSGRAGSSSQLSKDLAHRRQTGPIGSQHDLGRPTHRRSDLAPHPLSLPGNCQQGRVAGLDRRRDPPSRDESLPADLCLALRGTEERNRGPSAENSAPQGQRARCQSRGSPFPREKNGKGRQGPAQSIPHLRPGNRDPHPAGRFLARCAASRRSPMPTAIEPTRTFPRPRRAPTSERSTI